MTMFTFFNCGKWANDKEQRPRLGRRSGYREDIIELHSPVRSGSRRTIVASA